MSIAEQRAEIAALVADYCLACDTRDRRSLLELFDADARATYDDADELRGASPIAAWICEATAHLAWQQHSAQVMNVQIDGARADVVAYLTSHQVAAADTSHVTTMVSRYDLVLANAEKRWRIVELDLEVGITEQRPARLGPRIGRTHKEAT
ncbi:nuclear transport factor 2 family protein [Gordonia sp. GONU]|uniref:nuclear transport factor 2 family protein n=1 Tax=Gordonia TaxID=2053 RepID=UPI00041D41E2|nr:MULTISPECIES: nuclear transport factor 2 family protein [Gordonia]MCR8896045.1 nuclear transport factor 2 family protein [Gordonia sp. GONU]MCZ4650591.1 nuclear transport factor 2 family protein [Gordonia amicalis]